VWLQLGQAHAQDRIEQLLLGTCRLLASLLPLPYSAPLQRHDDRRKEIEGMMAIVAKADATDRAAVDKVFAGARLLRVRQWCVLQCICVSAVGRHKWAG
jgi:hypothetical protein